MTKIINVIAVISVLCISVWSIMVLPVRGLIAILAVIIIAQFVASQALKKALVDLCEAIAGSDVKRR